MSVCFSCADEKTVYEVCLNKGTSVTGDMILNELGIEGSFGANIGILFAFTVVFRAIAYGALRFLHSPK